MNQDKILKIIKGLNRFSLDDIVVMTGFDETEINDILENFSTDGIVTKVSEFEYRYINKIPERREMFRLVEKPEIKIIPDNNITFRQAADYFLVHHAKENCTPSTFKTYISISNVHLLSFFGKMKLKNITQKEIKEFIALKQKQYISNRRIRNCVTLFGNMFNKFKEWGFVSDTPYNGIINVKFKKKTDIKILNETEVKLILANAKKNSPILYKFILLALLSGLKKAEIFALKKSDIDFKNKKIKINKTLYMGKVIISKVKTAIRQINIPENIIPDLKKAIKNKRENDFIFYDKALSYYTQDKRLRKTFANIVKQLQLDKFTFNELRHTYAYRALQNGMSIDYLHKQLGDYSIQATMDKYRDFIS